MNEKSLQRSAKTIIDGGTFILEYFVNLRVLVYKNFFSLLIGKLSNWFIIYCCFYGNICFRSELQTHKKCSLSIGK